jgi:branched-chain amino acid aminotransferase
VERPVDRSGLYVSDEVFFVGTAVEIAPVVGVDHRTVDSGEPGPVATELRRLYQKATRGQMSAYAKWLVPVYHPAALDRVA